MYFDHKPCDVCGAEVELKPREPTAGDRPDEPVGPEDGVVGKADPTVEVRVCTNRDCPTHAGDGEP